MNSDTSARRGEVVWINLKLGRSDNAESLWQEFASLELALLGRSGKLTWSGSRGASGGLLYQGLIK